MTHPLLALPTAYHAGLAQGITSVCSAHPIVIEAALLLAKETGRYALIEATCNQVNQHGGYTGMTPADFRASVEAIAANVGLDIGRIIFGGDHLGPNPWKHLKADEAMEMAEEMIAAYATAGFTKLHLDTSMGCAGEPVALDDRITAQRAARLASVAERSKSGGDPVYIIGTEVPVPGGALEELDELAITSAEAVNQTYEVHRTAFMDAGVQEAFDRVIALVVQPGVEFGHTDVVHFAPEKARDLSKSLAALPGVIFEAHSTDYQTEDALAKLVQNGFAILKVGPWLTFALRETLYGLDAIADVLDGHAPRNRLMSDMEALMQSAPANWVRYYEGDDNACWLQRHFSYSDRIRYYWPEKDAQAAVTELFMRLEGRLIPEPVRQQYLATSAKGTTAKDILINAVQSVLRRYETACAV